MTHLNLTCLFIILITCYSLPSTTSHSVLLFILTHFRFVTNAFFFHFDFDFEGFLSFIVLSFFISLYRTFSCTEKQRIEYNNYIEIKQYRQNLI